MINLDIRETSRWVLKSQGSPLSLLRSVLAMLLAHEQVENEIKEIMDRLAIKKPDIGVSLAQHWFVILPPSDSGNVLFG